MVLKYRNVEDDFEKLFKMIKNENWLYTVKNLDNSELILRRFLVDSPKIKFVKKIKN